MTVFSNWSIFNLSGALVYFEIKINCPLLDIYNFDFVDRDFCSIYFYSNYIEI